MKLFVFFALLFSAVLAANLESYNSLTNTFLSIIEADFKVANTKSKLDHLTRVRVGAPGAGFEMRYELDNRTQTDPTVPNPTVVVLHLEAKMVEVVYYSPDSTPGFQDGSDTVISRTRFSALTYRDLVCGQAGRGFSCDINGTVGSLTVLGHAYVSPITATVSNSANLLPSMIKWDIIIPKPNTYSVALTIRVEADSAVGDTPAADTQWSGVDGVVVDKKGTFKWTRNWGYDSGNAANIPVIVSSVSATATNEGGEGDGTRVARAFTFSFEDSGTGKIVFDPWLGSPAFQVVPSLLFVAFLLIALLF